MDNEDDGIELAAAITMLRQGLLQARAAGADAEIQLPVSSMTLELKVVATRNAKGEAGFRVPLVGAKLGVGGSLSQETTQTITIIFGEPINPAGEPVPVASSSDELKQ